MFLPLLARLLSLHGAGFNPGVASGQDSVLPSDIFTGLMELNGVSAADGTVFWGWGSVESGRYAVSAPVGGCQPDPLDGGEFPGGSDR